MSRQEQEKLIAFLLTEVRKFIAGAILFNEKVAKDLGLNGTDLQCLNLLDLEGSLKPGELAEWCALTTGGVTVIMDRLEKAGYIRRHPNPTDRRSSIIRLVPAQARKLRSIYRSKGDALLEVLAGYDEGELRLILDFFQKTNSASADWQDETSQTKPSGRAR
jgi:DNA-binding MarR family transcriptional regulator